MDHHGRGLGASFSYFFFFRSTCHVHWHIFSMMMFCVSLILWGRGLHVAGTNGKGSVCAMTFVVCDWPAGGNSAH